MDDLEVSYLRFNTDYFGGNLQPVQLMWSHRLIKVAGRCTIKEIDGVYRATKIELSTHYISKFPDDAESILLHEMIHVKYPLDGHGDKFIMEMLRLNKKHNLHITPYSKEVAKISHRYVCEICGAYHNTCKALTSKHFCSYCRRQLVESIIT